MLWIFFEENFPAAASAEEKMAFRSKEKGKAEFFAILVGKEKVDEYLRQLKPLQILTLRGRRSTRIVAGHDSFFGRHGYF